jgi:hypothetical protein
MQQELFINDFKNKGGGYPQVPAKSTRGTRQAVPGAVSGVWFWGKKHPVPGCKRVPGSSGAIPIAYLFPTQTPTSIYEGDLINSFQKS